MSLAENSRPLLTIGKVPLSLQAYKAKFKLVSDDGAAGQKQHSANPCGHGIQLQPAHGSEKETTTKSPPKPVRGRLPFCVIAPGQVYEGARSFTDAKGRAKALNAWCWKIAREAAAPYGTKAEQDAVTGFVKSHRLSIANAFERRIVRKDVVTA
jgi:hypothetical protein